MKFVVSVLIELLQSIEKNTESLLSIKTEILRCPKCGIKYAPLYPRNREKIEYTPTEWYSFNLMQQEILCKKFDIVMIDYIPFRRLGWRKRKIKMEEYGEKVFKGLDRFNAGVNKFFKEYDKGMKYFNEGMKGFAFDTKDKEIKKMFGGNTKKYSDSLFGKSSKKRTTKKKKKKNLEKEWQII